MKVCSSCERSLELEDFSKHKSSNDGRRSQCRACLSAARRKKSDIPPGHKRCPRCEEVLPLGGFGVNVSRKDGRKAYCRPCATVIRLGTSDKTNEARRQARGVKAAEIRLAAEIAAAVVMATGKKVCGKCGDLKLVSEFWKRKTSLDGYYASCKKCIKDVRNRPDPEDEERSSRWAVGASEFENLVQTRRLGRGESG